MEMPETRYAAVGDADVAYQIAGSGPIDLLAVGGFGSHIELAWQSPPFVEYMRRLASIGRVILFDRRGTGLSDPVPRHAMPTWEEWAEDMAAILDIAGSSRAAVIAQLDAGPAAMLFAAMHPDRVSALILSNTAARLLQDTDYPIGISSDTIDALVAGVGATWGTPAYASVVTPEMARDPEAARLLATISRASMTPRSAAVQADYVLRTNDARRALPLIQAPTLVFYSRANPIVPVECARYLVDHISDARLIELPEPDLIPLRSRDQRVADEIIRFVTGEQPIVEIERILTTMLFTDIVRSTERAATLGDQRWNTLLDSHDRVVREQVGRFRGREVKTTGDGFLVSFDGPARAIRCSQAIVDGAGELGVDLRMGLHTGECEVRGGDLGGIAVHIAARVNALARPGEIVVSSTVKDLVVGSGIEFEDRGQHELKGVPGTWKLFAVVG
jgi:class 3 adenylate cyclase/alpha-beta hydrolase superfamily lysophospholipase